MFCRACWANVPDTSLRCPRCDADPRAVPPEAAVPAPAAPAPVPSAPAWRGGGSANRLTVLLAALLALLVAGPFAVQWYEARRVRQALGSDATPPPDREARALTQVAPPRVEPGAGATGPEAALSREAFALYQQGRVAEACERYRQVVDRAPGEEARRALGSCFARLGWDASRANDVQRAVEHYRQAVEAYPEAPGSRRALAIAYAKAGDRGRAQAVLEQAARDFPEDPETLYQLADLQERQGRTREAVETLRRLLALQSGHARGRSLLATLDREQKVEGSYWAQESPHFLVRYEGAGGLDVGRSVADALEEAYESIGRDLGVFPKDRIQAGIYAEEVLGGVIGAPAHYIRGAYDGRKIRLNLAKSVAYSSDLSRLVRHEYTHAVIHLATNGRASIWLHEGLAQVMEPRAAPRSLDVSVPREYLTLTGIERLSRTMDPVAFTTGYALTHVAVEYLVERGGLSGARDFLARIGRGQAMPEAMREAFGAGPEDVEARLLAVAGRS